MNPLREQREYAVHEALQRERQAWGDLERAARPNAADELSLDRYRRRWLVASRRLVAALEALKASRSERR